MTDTLHMTLSELYDNVFIWHLLVCARVGKPHNQDIERDFYNPSSFEITRPFNLEHEEYESYFEVYLQGDTTEPITLPATTPVVVTLYPDSKWQDCLDRARALREKYGESKKQDVG